MNQKDLEMKLREYVIHLRKVSATSAISSIAMLSTDRDSAKMALGSAQTLNYVADELRDILDQWTLS